MLADERPINARPWLYRIARNRCLNHLRRPVPAGLDSMDVFERDGGVTTADTVHRREEFRQIVADVQDLPETQRTALLLREIDALSYEEIAQTMDTTVPAVKSLLVRARISLAALAPLGPLALLHKLFIAKLGGSGSAAGGSAAGSSGVAGGTAVAGTSAGAAAAGAGGAAAGAGGAAAAASGGGAAIAGGAAAAGAGGV